MKITEAGFKLHVLRSFSGGGSSLLSPASYLKRTRFTLIELLIVIAIISILAGMLFPALGKVKAKSGDILCKSNLKQMSMLCGTYATDNNDFLLPATIAADGGGAYKWYNVLMRMGNKEEMLKSILLCPLDRNPYDWGSYAYNNALGYSFYTGNETNRLRKKFRAMRTVLQPSKVFYMTDVHTDVNPYTVLWNGGRSTWNMSRLGTPVYMTLAIAGGSFGNFGFSRHEGKVNAAWLDGHAGDVDSITCIDSLYYDGNAAKLFE